MAIPLQGEPRLIDPHGGLADLEAGLLRVLHRGSFRDDPTRALRAARYAARFGFELEAGTEALLREADLDTVSADRREADLRRVAAEPEAIRGLALLSQWGLIDLRDGGLELASVVAELLAGPPWEGVAPRGRRDPRRRPRADRAGREARGDEAAATVGGRRCRRGMRPGRARPRPGDRRRVARPIPARVARRLARDRRSRPDRRRGSRGSRGRPRPGGGAAGKARRRGRRARAGARGGARGGGRDRWSGVVTVRSSGSKRGCRAPGSRSRPGRAGSARPRSPASTSAT